MIVNQPSLATVCGAANQLSQLTVSLIWNYSGEGQFWS